MKRLLLVLTLLLPCLSYADLSDKGSETFDADTTKITLTSSTVTQIMVRDSFIRRTFIVNPSTFAYVCISSFAATVAISSTSQAAIPPNFTFTPDGPVVPYWGPMWAALCDMIAPPPSASQKISVFRTK